MEKSGCGGGSYLRRRGRGPSGTTRQLQAGRASPRLSLLRAHRLGGSCAASQDHGYIMVEWASRPLPKQPANPLWSLWRREGRWAGGHGGVEFGGNRVGEETPLPRLPFDNELRPDTQRYPAPLVNHGDIPPRPQGREAVMPAMEAPWRRWGPLPVLAVALQSGRVAATASLASGLFNSVPVDNEVPASERKRTSNQFNWFNYTS